MDTILLFCLFVCLFLCGAEDWTWCLTCARQVLYQWATTPVPEPSFIMPWVSLSTMFYTTGLTGGLSNLRQRRLLNLSTHLKKPNPKGYIPLSVFRGPKEEGAVGKMNPSKAYLQWPTSFSHKTCQQLPPIQTRMDWLGYSSQSFHSEHSFINTGALGGYLIIKP